MQTSVNAVRANMLTSQSIDPLAILREAFELLQDYAPIWYTESLHRRMASALGEPEFEPALP